MVARGVRVTACPRKPGMGGPRALCIGMGVPGWASLMKNATSKIVASLLLLPLLGTSPVLAQASPVHVTAEASFPTVQQGGFQDVGCRIDNVSGEPVMVLIKAFVTYADGTVQEFRGLTQGPVLIEPDGAFLLFIGFAVPQDAALGTATFTCEVRVVGSAGMGATESATATFEVVAA